MKTSCDEFCASNGFVQANNCPARVAKAKPVMMAADPLPPSVWRYQLRKLAYWMLLAVLGVTVWPLILYLVMSV
jgi:hypothetical protein